MTYTILLKRSAEKELANLPDEIHDRIVEKLQSLIENPNPKGVKKLRGSKEAYRLRIGSYRVLYIIRKDESKIEVYSIAHRKDVYK